VPGFYLACYLIINFVEKTEKPMEQFKNLSLSQLVDKLSEYTAKYSQIRTEGGLKKEFEECRLFIDYLTNEIELRKKTPTNNEIISDSQVIFFNE
jgi:hypothetical protein